MVRAVPDKQFTVVPVLLAAVLHAFVFGSLFVALDWSRAPRPVVPLAITATLITESAVVIAPPLEQVPEPIAEPIVESSAEPETPQPDPAEEARLEAEEQKRLEDQRLELERLQRIEDAKAEAERRRQAELEAQRQAEEAARLKREAELEAQRKAAQEEAELERRRIEAERERQRDIERQREQNRLEEERLVRQRQQAEIDAEAERLEARNSDEMRAYQAAIQQKVLRNWVRPATAPDDLECFVAIRQLSNGEVVSVQVVKCNGDDVVIRSIEVAVKKASPLPLPSNPILFLRDFQFRFTIRD